MLHYRHGDSDDKEADIEIRSWHRLALQTILDERLPLIATTRRHVYPRAIARADKVKVVVVIVVVVVTGGSVASA
jgi:hypothetical protein